MENLFVPETYGKKGQIIHKQTREMLCRLMQFMEAESEYMKRHGQPLVSLTNISRRMQAATGISERSYQRIRKEFIDVIDGNATSLREPREPTKHKRKQQERDPLAVDPVTEKRSKQSKEADPTNETDPLS